MGNSFWGEKSGHASSSTIADEGNDLMAYELKYRILSSTKIFKNLLLLLK